MSNEKSKTNKNDHLSLLMSNKKKTISNYNKKQLLKMLKEGGCHPTQLDKMIRRFRVTNVNIIKDFVNNQAEISQNRLEKMLQTKNQRHFLNLNESVKTIMDSDELSPDNTLPVTLEAIANLEQHPSPDDIHGIDLNRLYELLANMSAGYPVEDLEDGPTKEFLQKCYKDLMNSATDMEPKSFRNALTKQDKQTRPVYSWLCNSDYTQYINQLFKNICSDSDDNE